MGLYDGGNNWPTKEEIAVGNAEIAVLKAKADLIKLRRKLPHDFNNKFVEEYGFIYPYMKHSQLVAVGDEVMIVQIPRGKIVLYPDGTWVEIYEGER